MQISCAAEQSLCFFYIDSTIPLLPKSEISSLYPSSVEVQPGLCRTWVENPEDRFSQCGSIDTLSGIHDRLVLPIINIRFFISIPATIKPGQIEDTDDRISYQPGHLLSLNKVYSVVGSYFMQREDRHPG